MAKEKWPDWDVYVRDGCVCVYCGLDGKQDPRIWRQLQIDHLIPRKHGGPDKPENKVVSCTRCNVQKGDTDPRAFLKPPQNRQPSKPALIAAAQEIIESAKARSGETADYDLMMSEISSRDEGRPE